MCLKCHLAAFGNRETEILPQLTSFKDESFGEINSTSFSHFTIAATGYNGEKCRVAAMDIIRRFIAQVRKDPEVFVGFALSPLESEEYYTAIYDNLEKISADQYPKTEEELFRVLRQVWTPFAVDERS